MQKYVQNIRLVLIAILLYTTGASAQVLQWSTPTKLKGTAVFTRVIGENEQGIYLLRYRNRFYSKNVILERYDHLLTLQNSKVIDLKNARLSKIYMTPKGLLLIKSKYSRSTQQNILSGQWYDYGFKPIGPPVSLASSTPIEFGDRGNFRIRISDNLQNISLIYSEKTKTEEILIHHKLFDIALNLENEKHFELPFAYITFIISDFLVTNAGETNILCKNVTRERRKISSSINSIYTIYNGEIKDFLITDSVEIKSANLAYSRAEDAARIVAFYGIEDTPGVLGTLSFKLSSDRTYGILDCSPFPEKLINNVELNDRNNGAISEGFGILEAIPRSDGGMLIIAEQKEVATEDDIILVNGIPQSTSKNIYNFNELLIISYDSSAFVDWHKVVTKNQTTVNDGGYFSSVAIYVGDKYIQLLYNDQIRSSGDVMQYTIYNNGVEESKKLLKTELDFVAIIPEESSQVSSNKLIIPTSKNRRFSLLKLVYN